MELKGKVALITGAGKGIGRGIALCLAAQGAKIAVNYHASEAAALKTEADILAMGAEIMLYRADVSQRDQVAAMVDAVLQRFGRVDILINNAALQKNMELMEYTEADYDVIMDINVKGYWMCAQAVFPFMKAQSFGRIINISSVHGKRPTDFDPVYAMSKGAVKMLTRECAVEFAQYGITVNTIEPAAVQIEFKTGNPGPIRYKRTEKARRYNRYLIGRIGVPEDVGHLAAFLASEKSGFITGSAIRMDGAAMLV